MSVLNGRRGREQRRRGKHSSLQDVLFPSSC